MDTIYIRRTVKGKSFAASAEPGFQKLEGETCPLTGDTYEAEVKKVNANNAEIMGINFAAAVEGVQSKGIFYDLFKINLGETMIIEN